MRIVLHRQPEIEVVDSDGVVGVYMDNDCQGRAKVTDGIIRPISPFYDLITCFIGCLEEKPGNILYLGGGACIVPTFLQQTYGIGGTVVEPSEFMQRIAIDTFRFDKRFFDVSSLSGIEFLRSSDRRYDVILLDAFDGFTPDEQLYSWQGYQLCKDHLNDSGLLLTNYISSSVAAVQLHGSCLGSVFNEYGGSGIKGTVPHQAVMWARKLPLTLTRKDWTRTIA